MPKRKPAKKSKKRSKRKRKQHKLLIASKNESVPSIFARSVWIRKEDNLRQMPTGIAKNGKIIVDVVRPTPSGFSSNYNFPKLVSAKKLWREYRLWGKECYRGGEIKSLKSFHDGRSSCKYHEQKRRARIKNHQTFPIDDYIPHTHRMPHSISDWNIKKALEMGKAITRDGRIVVHLRKAKIPIYRNETPQDALVGDISAWPLTEKRKTAPFITVVWWNINSGHGYGPDDLFCIDFKKPSPVS